VPRPLKSASPADEHRPEWFEQFLADRGTRKPSAHTLKAYRQDFDAIATLLAGDSHDLVRLPLTIIDTEAMRSAFAEYARTHEAASIRRCWSTWNVLCTFLFTAELIAANPMPMIGRPKQPKALPKSLPPESVTALLAAVSTEPQRPRTTDWLERDRAIIITGLLAGLRADEMVRANIGDLRRTDDGAVIQVRGKGDKDRRIPVEPVLVDVLEHYLDSRKTRFPRTTRRSSPTGGLAAWPASAPLFVGGDGQRITRGTLQYRALRAFRQAGIDGTRAKGALLHGLRHTFATELANADVSVYALMNLLGHEAMTTSQRYISAAGTDTRHAAAKSGLYDVVRSTQ
jgi:site-specific recombinase XerD